MQGPGLVALGGESSRPSGGVLAEVATEPTGETHPPPGDGLGLYYMQARLYDPVTGRFQSVDPALRSLAAPCRGTG